MIGKKKSKSKRKRKESCNKINKYLRLINTQTQTPKNKQTNAIYVKIPQKIKRNNVS